LEEARVHLEPGGWERRRGGTVTTLAARTQLRRTAAGVKAEERANFTLGHHEGREVAFLAPHGTTRIPGIVSAGEPLMIVVGGYVPEVVPPGAYVLGINQRDADEVLTGGLGVEVNLRKPEGPGRARRRGGK